MILLDGDATPTANPTRWRNAVAWHAERTPVSRETWDALSEAARQRAFTVSGVASASLLTDVHAAIERAVANGTTFADFKREVGARLEAEWGRPNAPRLETIFRTNVQTAYNAARHQEMSRPEVKAARPFWRFVAILDPRTSPVCRPLDQTLRPADDDFWKGHWPPLHHNCRSTVVSLSRRQAEREGGVTAVPEGEHVHPPAKGFGRTPDLAGESIEVTERAPAGVREAVEARPRPRPHEEKGPEGTEAPALSADEIGLHIVAYQNTHPTGQRIAAWLHQEGIRTDIPPEIGHGRHGEPINGQYDHDLLLISVAAIPRQFDPPFRRGQTWSVGEGAVDARDAYLRTWSHEVGEAIYARVSSRTRGDITADFVRDIQAGTKLSRYQILDNDYFAELFAAFVHEPNALTLRERQLVERVMQEVGL